MVVVREVDFTLLVSVVVVVVGSAVVVTVFSGFIVVVAVKVVLLSGSEVVQPSKQFSGRVALHKKPKPLCHQLLPWLCHTNGNLFQGMFSL